MTNVIAFKLRRKRTREAQTGPFQLLFFTGVRYMRQDERVVAKPRKTPRAPRKRQA